MRALPGYENRWAAPLGPEGAWIELAWEQPQTIKQVQLTFDSGFVRELTLSSSAAANVDIIRAPQPETVKKYSIQYQAGDGKDYPITGAEGSDTISLTRVDERTVRFVQKKAGKVVSTGTRVVSPDGKTLTITSSGTNVAGQPTKSTLVFERR